MPDINRNYISMDAIKPETTQQSEISLKDLLLKIQDWIGYLWRKWLIILVCGIVGAGLGVLYSMSKETRYVAELTFVLEDSKQSTLGAYTGLASQFGLDLGVGSSSGIFSGDNIMEFLKSRLIIEKALLSPLTQNNRTLSLADYYLEISGARKAWGNNSAAQSINYPINAKRNAFTIQQDSVLNLIYEEIKTQCLDITKSDKKSSFIIVECTTQDEIFSKVFTERLVKEAADFYVRTKTMRSKSTVDKLQLKADSLETLLNRKTYSVAASQDMNLNPARSMAGVNTELASRDKLVLQTMYGYL